MKTIKTIILSFCFLVAGVGIVRAQQGTAASGGVAIGAGGSMSYTVGQLDYVSITGSGGAVNQGVQQTYEVLIETGSGENTIKLSASVYPNPTTAFLFLSINCTKDDNLSYQIYDPLGKLLITKKLMCSEIGISIADLPNAVYFMKIYNNNKEIKTFKIFKIK